MSELKEQWAAAVAFAEANVVECSRELIVWRNTALLPDGKVREMAVLCEFSPEPLALAEHLIVHAALEAVARMTT